MNSYLRYSKNRLRIIKGYGIQNNLELDIKYYENMLACIESLAL